MRKKYLSHLRPLSLLLIALWSVLILGCPSPIIPRPIIEGIAIDQLGVSILSVNLLGISNVPRNDRDGVRWQTRYTRIFEWMRNTKTFPDVIALQEATAFMQCFLDRTLPDYAAIDFLLDGIRDATGEQYRIAYLITGRPGGGEGDDWTGNIASGGCSSRIGNALLYRPSRLRNVITSPRAGDSVVSPYEDPFPLLRPYLAKSAYCCSPASDRTDVCSLIDGPLVTPPPRDFETRGSCPTPLGVAWARSRPATGGADRSRPSTDAMFSRFQLVNQPESFIHIYNVHRGWNQDWEDQHPGGPPAPQELDFGSQNINQLVTDMEDRFRPLGQTLYPPILVGDFNIGTDLTDSYFPRFEAGVFYHIDGVLFGKRSNFPSKQAAYANLPERMPALLEGEKCDSDSNKLWSDHCGVFFRVEPSRR